MLSEGTTSGRVTSCAAWHQGRRKCFRCPQYKNMVLPVLLLINLFSIHRILLSQITIVRLRPKVPLSKYIEASTQYGINHFRMNPGRSAKCYVNPLNDLFKLPTITIQRWLAADTGAHLSFCPIVSLCGAPYCERRGVGCPVALVANG